MAISLKELYDKVNSGGVSDLSACVICGTPSNSAICGTPAKFTYGDNFCTYDNKFGFTLTAGTYLMLASSWSRNNNEDGGGDSRQYITIKEGTVVKRTSGNQPTAHWGGDTQIAPMIVKSTGSTVITAQTVFSGRLGSTLNGWVMFLRISKTYLVSFSNCIKEVVRKWLSLYTI